LLLLDPQGNVWRQKCSKFVVALLRCGQCVVGWWRSDGFDAGESVGDNAVPPRNLSYVGGELGYEIEVVELQRREFVRLLLEGVGDGLMVSEDGEVARFQHVTEMLHGLVDSQQLSIVGALFLLGWVQLPGEEGEGAARRCRHVAAAPHGGSGGVCDDCK
jgi:hypothetical protein